MGLLPTSGLWNCATSQLRGKRAKTGLARPVPAPITTNNAWTSSGAEGDRRSNDGVAVRNRRIQWTCALDADLARCNEGISLRPGEGRQKELVRLWQDVHPELPATVNALSQRLSRICKLGSVPALSPGGPNVSPNSVTPCQLDSKWTSSLEGSLVSSDSEIVRQPGNELASSPGRSAIRTGSGNAEVRGEGSDEPRRTRTRARTDVAATTPGVSTPEVRIRRPGRPRKHPTPEASGSAYESELDGGHNAERAFTGDDELSNSNTLRNEFLSVLRTVEACEEGDLSKRGRPSCKGTMVSQRLMRTVDDSIVEEYQKGERSHWRLNRLVYAGAELVASRVKRTFAATKKQPSLKRREAKVTHLRRIVGWLEAEIRRRRIGQKATPRQWRNIRHLKLERCSLRELETSLETKKANLRVRVTQLRRLRASARSSSTNTAYRRQGPACLSGGSRGKDQGFQHPSADEVSRFWEGVIGVEGEWDPLDPAILDWAYPGSDAPAPGVVEPVDGNVWGKVVKKLNSWKAPGRHGICGFWWKQFHQAKELLRRTVWHMLEGDSDSIPTCFVKGRTVLIPKEGCQGRPEQYRPITCLNTEYKLLIAVMTEVLYDHAIAYSLLPPEQRAIRRGHRGCLDALMIDSMVAKEAMVRHRDLSVAWIDYQKAYDRVPHEWMSWMLSYIKAPLSVQVVLDNLQKQWSSVFCVGTEEGAVRTELQFRRGLFQGDSLSPLLFCLSIAPISHALRESSGFSVPYLGSPVTHLFFMDDLKVYARNSDILGDTLRVVDRVSRAVGMELGLRKCAVAHVKRGKYVGGENYLLPEERKIERVAQGGTYWYLGIEQLFRADHTSVRERLTKVYAQRLHRIWSSALSSKHKVHATNTWAVSVFRYFFALVKWPLKELIQLDRLTRKILRRFKSHHLSASIECLYLRRASGGRGLVNIRQAYEGEVVASELYMANAGEDELLQAVVKHQLYLSAKGKHSILQAASDVLRQHEVCPDLVRKLRSGEAIPHTRESVLELKAAQAVQLVSTLTAKPIHKVYFQQASSAEGVDTEGTFGWLSDGRFRAETEGLVIAAQDGVILTNRYKHTVLKTSATSTCRVCREGEETVGHILSSCGPHMWTLYKERHDRVVYRLMMALAKRLDVTVPDSMKWGVDGWHGVAALSGAKARIVVDLSVPTDRQLPDRRPDILLYLKGE